MIYLSRLCSVVPVQDKGRGSLRRLFGRLPLNINTALLLTTDCEVLIRSQMVLI